MKHVIFDCDGTLVDTNSPKYKLFPGVRELLETLSKECLLYVWTARGRSSTLRVLEELGIYSYFDSLSTIDDPFPKPHIGGLQSLVGNVPKHSVCIIGDSAGGMIGAKSFGVIGIGALWNDEKQRLFLQDTGADFLVSHPRECSKLIELNLRGDTDV